jgi:DNA topoisomerase-3
MVIKKGKNGPFWGCNNYPNCKTTANDDNGKPKFK